MAWQQERQFVKGESGGYPRSAAQSAFKTLVSSVISLLAIQGLSNTLSVAGPSPELPVPTTVRDLVNEPTQYDGHRVLVSGLIRSIELGRGRRGSEYFVVVLKEPGTAPSEAVISVTVISDPVPNIRKGQRATVRGVFHREGNQRGHPYEYFIDAEAVLREDKPNDF